MLKEFLKKQGAVFYRLMPKHYKILIIQYAIRKYKLYKKNNRGCRRPYRNNGWKCLFKWTKTRRKLFR